MTDRRSAFLSRWFTMIVVLAAVAALVRAQTEALDIARTHIRKEAQAAQQAAGLAGSANRKALFSQHPTPEIALARPVTVEAGETAPLSLTGKFSDKTVFVSGSPHLELTGATVAANGFKATAKVAAGVPPQFLRVYAFEPVSAAETWTPAVFVGKAPLAYSLTASNGWKVELTPEAPAFTHSDRKASVVYRASFFKPGESSPFEFTTGPLTLDPSNSYDTQYTFSMSAGGANAAMTEVEALSKRLVELMQSGKVSGKEFADVQKKMESAQARFQKEMEQQQADPAAAQRKEDAFGCRDVRLTHDPSGVKGHVGCGKDVGSLTLTGTVK